jgi:cytochrome c-type biogenesis protein CcmH/NrfG
VAHLRKSVELDPKYSAGWKLLGKAYETAGRLSDAEQAWREGVSVSEANGDLQAAKEMKVFLKRLEKTRSKD